MKEAQVLDWGAGAESLGDTSKPALIQSFAHYLIGPVGPHVELTFQWENASYTVKHVHDEHYGE